MKLRIMNYELRDICSFVAGLSAAGLSLAGIVGCSDPNTAGVWTETESGHQASNGDWLVDVESCSNSIPENIGKKTATKALQKSNATTNCITYDRTYAMVSVQGTATDESGSPLKMARVRLSSFGGSGKETTTDDNGTYKFDNVVYKATYHGFAPLEDGEFEQVDDTTRVTYIDYKLLVASSDSTLASVHTINFKDYKRMGEGDSVYLEIPEQSAGKATDITLPAKAFQKGDNACLDDIGVCHVMSADEIEAGEFVMKNVPQGVYQKLCAIQTEKTSSGEEMVSMRCAMLSEPIIAKDAVDTLSFELPESALSQMDSLTDKSIERILVPVKTSAEKPYIISGNSITKLVSAGSKDLYWAEISFIDTNAASYILFDEIPYFSRTSVFAAVESLADTTLVNSSAYWNRTYIGFSFKVKADGSEFEEAAVLLSTVDSTAAGLPKGYEILQCEAGSKSVCVRVYSGTDSVVTDTVVYGKANLLDGEEHIFSMVMVGNHLSVAVDGEILRDTDLKLGDSFPYYEGGNPFMNIGNVELRNFVMFDMPSRIRKGGESNWNRLKAWLIAHQTFSK